MVREGGLVGGGVEDDARDEPACSLPEDDISVCVWEVLIGSEKSGSFSLELFGATEKSTHGYNTP